MNLEELKVVPTQKGLPYDTSYLEGGPWFANSDDSVLPHEDIAIVLVTNGWRHFSPTLVVDYNWVNHQKISKFFDCLDAAQTIFSEINWTVESQETQRE